jgi:hypothetical protein
MPSLRTYKIFITHAWDYDEDYYNLVDMLDEAYNFQWQNYSVPSHDPLETENNKELESALIDQIKFAQIVILLGGMYVPYRDWIIKEISISSDMRKPRGSYKMPQDIQDVASELVAWNTQSIVDAIRRNAL